MLRRKGLEPEFASNGVVEAVEKWETGGHDIILMDIQMPRNGFEATRAIRGKEGGAADIPRSSGCTAHAMKEDKARCLQPAWTRMSPSL